MATIKSPKKLIEVALPLDDINEASAREKSIRHGHPSSLHLWWARRPLAAARAVIFAQMVNDPGGERGYYAGKTKAQADAEREELFQILRDLVLWENINNEDVLARARAAIAKSWRETCELNKGKPGFDPEQLPAFHDPFAGGGAIPLEAQRLGLESYASDLNPVAVMINKAMIEIPPKFAGRAPVGPEVEAERGTKKANKNAFEDWSGARGMAEDVRRYGEWMRNEAEARIGHLYPRVKITKEIVVSRPDLKQYENEDLTVIAWIWARNVLTPSPAFSGARTPLMKSFRLSARAGKEVWAIPKVKNEGLACEFEIQVGGKAPDFDGTVGRTGAKCVYSGAPVPLSYIRAEGCAGRIGQQIVAVVAEGRRGRVYLSPTEMDAAILDGIERGEAPSAEIEHWSGCTNCVVYGFKRFEDLFTKRQLNALNLFAELIPEVIDKCKQDFSKIRGAGVEEAEGYARSVGLMLAFSIDKLADLNNSFVGWEPIAQCPRHLFGKQAIPMVWDFAESNPLSSSSGSWKSIIDGVTGAMEKMFPSAEKFLPGRVYQAPAQTQEISQNKVISTDPPYYDNVPYSNLSDFFYIWMRKSLKRDFKEIFTTLAVPRSEELVATSSRHGGKEQAEKYFVEGMTDALKNIAARANDSYPLSIYYAFKQSETSTESETYSTGWETFIESIIRAGLVITGTWPVRTENASRMRGQSSNALASSIVLVCRKREVSAETVSRREFQRQLREELPEALETMIGGASGQSPIAPVDLAQAAIGPGMAIYSQYSAVLNQDGTPMSVHDALILINREITDFLTPDAGNFDADTLFANGWFEQYGWSEGSFGEADVLARGKGTSVAGVAESGVVQSGGGKVRLLRWAEYQPGWDPRGDTRAPVWEATHHMIRALNTQGESAAGALLAAMPDKAEPIRQLAYHLYTLCERKKWADDARAYNELITAWHAVVAASMEVGHSGAQMDFDV